MVTCQNFSRKLMKLGGGTLLLSLELVFLSNFLGFSCLVLCILVPEGAYFHELPQPWA